MTSETSKNWITEWSLNFKPILATIESATPLDRDTTSIVIQYLKKTDLFDKHFWKAHFNLDVKEDLPSNIDAVLQQPCPFWPDKLVTETHLLALIPKAMNLNVFVELFKTQKSGNKVKIHEKGMTLSYDYKNSFSQRATCILMPRKVVSKGVSKDGNIVEKLYRLPHVAEISIPIMLEYIANETWIFSCHGRKDIYAISRSSHGGEWVMVGAFSAAGLQIKVFNTRSLVGFAPVRVIHLS